MTLRSTYEGKIETHSRNLQLIFWTQSNLGYSHAQANSTVFRTRYVLRIKGISGRPKYKAQNG